MTWVEFIADQRTTFGIPHVIACGALDVSESWFYKWRSRGPSDQELRRLRLDEAVKASFDDSGGTPGTYGSPRVWEDPDRRRLESVREHGGGFDGPPGAGGPQPETQTTVVDQA